MFQEDKIRQFVFSGGLDGGRGKEVAAIRIFVRTLSLILRSETYKITVGRKKISNGGEG